MKLEEESRTGTRKSLARQNPSIEVGTPMTLRSRRDARVAESMTASRRRFSRLLVHSGPLSTSSSLLYFSSPSTYLASPLPHIHPLYLIPRRNPLSCLFVFPFAARTRVRGWSSLDRSCSAESTSFWSPPRGEYRFPSIAFFPYSYLRQNSNSRRRTSPIALSPLSEP